MIQHLLVQSRRSIALVVLLSVLVFSSQQAANADEYHLNRTHHGWAKFGKGTWKTTEERVETLDESGKVKSVVTIKRKITLSDVNAKSYSLQTNISSEIAGTPFSKNIDPIALGFYGESENAKVVVKKLADEKIIIAKKEYTCHVQQIEISSATTKKVILDYYNEKHAPYVLKRITKALNPDNNDLLTETTFSLIAIEMPVKVGSEIKTCSYVRQIHKNHKVTIITVAVYSADMPGEIVSYSKKEINEKGKVIRRSTLNYGDFKIVHEKEIAIKPISRRELRPRFLRREERRENKK